MIGKLTAEFRNYCLEKSCNILSVYDEEKLLVIQYAVIVWNLIAIVTQTGLLITQIEEL